MDGAQMLIAPPSLSNAFCLTPSRLAKGNMYYRRMTLDGTETKGPDLIEPAADMGFGDMARRHRGPQAHGGLKNELHDREYRPGLKSGP